ncbi:Small glutamine-rich tetratricopeptide repeat-containing protein alpha [Pteropus alecto]|uniref:Small glutamine-rich tetratricopeptide repeat-containing protein alpha n=1 Tax=Pteropus alecto TaxID=9402 RepID=L5L8G7_PTEAL|nr:Small glutamine-rich tetratricopeptide repeat-containing protein alpha [Pteropus alecto]
MDNKKRLAYAIIRFLHDQLRHGGLSSDAQESLEVAIQCLETAFGVTVEDRDLALPQTLPEIFEAAAMGKEMPQHRDPERTPPSEEDSAEAERLKTEGNEQMKVENFEAAVHFYGKAIELNPANAVYFCNSLALSSLNKHTEAVVYYKKALELDPDNETYKSNLKIAELKLREAPSPTGGAGSFDIAGLLNNPSFMSMGKSTGQMDTVSPGGVSHAFDLAPRVSRCRHCRAVHLRVHNGSSTAGLGQRVAECQLLAGIRRPCRSYPSALPGA